MTLMCSLPISLTQAFKARACSEPPDLARCPREPTNETSTRSPASYKDFPLALAWHCCSRLGCCCSDSPECLTFCFASRAGSGWIKGVTLPAAQRAAERGQVSCIYVTGLGPHAQGRARSSYCHPALCPYPLHYGLRQLIQPNSTYFLILCFSFFSSKRCAT